MNFMNFKIRISEKENFKSALVMSTLNDNIDVIHGPGTYCFKIEDKCYCHVLINEKWDIEFLKYKTEYVMYNYQSRNSENNIVYLYCDDKPLLNLIMKKYGDLYEYIV